MTPKNQITVEATSQMADYRQWKLQQDHPLKTLADFNGDEEALKNHLLETYASLRQNQYELTVRNECMKVYNLACDGEALGPDNMQVWNGYKRYINAAKTLKEKERRQAQVNNCAISRAASMGAICFTGDGSRQITPQSNLHCCAISASAVLSEVAAQMGYDGEQNFMVAGKRSNATNNIVSAVYMAQNDSIAPAYRLNAKPEPLPSQRQKTLNSLIASGEVSIGDAVAVASSDNNTSSGYHAMVIADIKKDKSGKITSYTLQANNKHCLKTVDINDKNDYWGRKKVINAAQTHEWMTQKIKAEQQNLSTLSLEELEEAVQRQKAATLEQIEALRQTESYNATKGYNSQISAQYLKTLQTLTTERQNELKNALKNDFNHTLSPITPKVELAPLPQKLDPASRQELKQGLSQDRQQAEDFLSSYTTQLTLTDNTPLKKAMHNDFTQTISFFSQQLEQNNPLPTLKDLQNLPSSQEETSNNLESTPKKSLMPNMLAYRQNER